MFDLMISGGTVVDGSGSPGYRADVGIDGERVAAIGDLSAAQAARTIDAMGDRTAARYGLTRRGRIEKGFFADLVLFDAERIMDHATYDDPRQFPGGIPFVVVNGQVAVDQERCTGILAGQAVP